MNRCHHGDTEISTEIGHFHGDEELLSRRKYDDMEITVAIEMKNVATKMKVALETQIRFNELHCFYIICCLGDENPHSVKRQQYSNVYPFHAPVSYFHK